MKKTKFIVLAIICLTVIMLSTTTVSANYQSKDGLTRVQSSYNGWVKNIRGMEKYGGVMGLNETIDDSTLLAETSNSIDVHMMKNTEYGAMAILALSTEYGKQPSPDDNTGRLKKTRYIIGYDYSTVYGKRTSTGNVYGVDFNRSRVGTASVSKNNGVATSSIAQRYYDLYKVGNGYEIEYKDGDALKETRYWNNKEGRETWSGYYPYNDYVIFRIDDNPSEAYGYEEGFLYAAGGTGTNDGNIHARACIVNGDQI